MWPPSQKIDRPPYPRSMEPSMLFHSFTQRIGADGPCLSSREMIESPMAILRKSERPYNTARIAFAGDDKIPGPPIVVVFNQ